jgi:hypothetical protein
MVKVKSISIFLFVIFCAMIFCACGLNNDTGSKVDPMQTAIDYNNMLYETIQPLNKQYSLTEHNHEEIPLQNYTLGTISVYDKYGVRFAGLGIENKTVYHNWYSIQANENGAIDIGMFSLARTAPNSWSNGLKQTTHGRALIINFEPYNDLFFASVGGEIAYKNMQYFTVHSEEILFPVITNVTQFEMTKIISRGSISWNTSHTLRFRTYVVSYVKIVFEDTTYTNATIAEYRFSATVSSVYEFDSIFEYGEVL